MAMNHILTYQSTGGHMIRTALIVARADNGVIGVDNQLPWHLPCDLKYFKQVTMGKPVVMGRKTFESIGRPLPGRTNVVITRNADWSASGTRVVGSLADALKLATAQADLDGADEVMVIGGATLYREAIDQVDRMYVTQVHASPCGDAFLKHLIKRSSRELQLKTMLAMTCHRPTVTRSGIGGSLFN